MCGDSTIVDDVRKLMNGEKAHLVFTDPPYGMKKENVGVKNDNLNYYDLLEFNRQWIPLSFDSLSDVGSWYCWGIEQPLMDIYSNILKPMSSSNQITFRNLITWDKGNGQGQNSKKRRSYARADEKCLFVMKGVQGFNNNADNFYDDWRPILDYLRGEAEKVGLTRSDVKRICGVGMYSHWFNESQWRIIPENHYKSLQEAYPSAFKREYDQIKREYYETRAYFNNTHDNMNNVWHFNRHKKDGSEGGHATPKPIAICERAIKTSSKKEWLVLDLFGGSGSTLIACEKTGRRANIMELTPKYCDVIITRWQEFTACIATLEA
jgi:DNA modification methylase